MTMRNTQIMESLFVQREGYHRPSAVGKLLVQRYEDIDLSQWSPETSRFVETRQSSGLWLEAKPVVVDLSFLFGEGMSKGIPSKEKDGRPYLRFIQGDSIFTQELPFIQAGLEDTSVSALLTPPQRAMERFLLPALEEMYYERGLDVIEIRPYIDVLCLGVDTSGDSPQLEVLNGTTNVHYLFTHAAYDNLDSM